MENWFLPIFSHIFQVLNRMLDWRLWGVGLGGGVGDPELWGRLAFGAASGAVFPVTDARGHMKEFKEFLILEYKKDGRMWYLGEILVEGRLRAKFRGKLWLR